MKNVKEMNVTEVNQELASMQGDLISKYGVFSFDGKHSLKYSCNSKNEAIRYKQLRNRLEQLRGFYNLQYYVIVNPEWSE